MSIINDEASVTRSLKLSLETTGDYEVLTNNRARNALAAARAFRPELTLLDVMMPDMDGGEAAAQLQSDPLLRNIPIVFLTAIISNEETCGHEMVSGSMYYVAKLGGPACTEQRIRE